jgi:hypothetical protein
MDLSDVPIKVEIGLTGYDKPGLLPKDISLGLVRLQLVP